MREGVQEGVQEGARMEGGQGVQEVLGGREYRRVGVQEGGSTGGREYRREGVHEVGVQGEGLQG